MIQPRPQQWEKDTLYLAVLSWTDDEIELVSLAIKGIGLINEPEATKFLHKILQKDKNYFDDLIRMDFMNSVKNNNEIDFSFGLQKIESKKEAVIMALAFKKDAGSVDLLIKALEDEYSYNQID